MNDQTLEKISAELRTALVGRRFGKIFPRGRLALAIDFRLADGRFLFLTVEPAAPRLYLIRRRLRDLEKTAAGPGAFVLFLKKRLAGATVEALEKLTGERVLLVRLRAVTELGEIERYTLVAQLTGRSANVLLLDARGFVLERLRETSGEGQDIGTLYAPPVRAAASTPPPAAAAETDFPVAEGGDLSDALDAFYLEKEAARRFDELVKTARARVRQELGRRRKLREKLARDLENHGDADHWKRLGDLILANLADAVRIDGRLLVVDYFDERTPTLEIPIDESDSPTEAAEKFFRRYAKARNAKTEITRRLTALDAERDALDAEAARVERAAAEGDEAALREIAGAAAADDFAGRAKTRRPDHFTGARRFRSTDDYEILVGKASKDNDHLTFRIAKSLDLWLHAADYPGSHVIVRNPNRGEIPPRTLLEAAQLAAFYSHARQQPKVAVHYTPKKHVNKPKGAAAGLVSLASFKTILVEPKIDVRNEN